MSAGDARTLLDLLAGLREKADRQAGNQKPVNVVVIQEAGLDGFWLHRLLEGSKATSWIPPRLRSTAQAASQAIDADALLRTLMAWSRGKRRVC